MTHPKKVWHKDEKGWHSLIMEAVDANHAVAVDPANWAFEKPPEDEPLPELREIEVDLGQKHPIMESAITEEDEA